MKIPLLLARLQDPLATLQSLWFEIKQAVCEGRSGINSNSQTSRGYGIGPNSVFYGGDDATANFSHHQTPERIPCLLRYAVVQSSNLSHNREALTKILLAFEAIG